MRNQAHITIGIAALTAALLLGGCQKEDKSVRYVTQELRFDLPEELAAATSASIEQLTLRNTNTAEVFNIAQPQNATAGQTAAKGLHVRVTVPEGLYSVDMEGQAQMEGLLPNKIKAHIEGVSITEAEAALGAKPISTFVSQYSDDGGWVIAEIFFTGTQTPEGMPYYGDTYFRIYNNSSRTLCADGLGIAESELLTVEKYDYTPDPVQHAFAACCIYRIPLGSNIMVEPGQSLLLVDEAIDHRVANPLSFDLSGADFEWFDPNGEDIDNPEVPNLEQVAGPSYGAWALHNRGFKSYVLCRLGDDEAHQLTAQQYADSSSAYFCTFYYNFVFNGETYPMSSDAWLIPHAWVIDAVNLSVESEYQMLLTPPALDMGYTYVGKVDFDEQRYGKSVRRKVKAGIALQDTNNSSIDFEPEQPADPHHRFHQ